MSKLTEIAKQITNDFTYFYTDEADMLDKTEQAINAYIAEVIGEDHPKPPLGDFWNVGRNQLRAEQRKRAGL